MDYNNKNSNINKFNKVKKAITITKEDDFDYPIFFSKYHAVKVLGEGSFGKVYEVVYNENKFALKVEDKNENNLLEKEAKVLKLLKGPNIPKFEFFGEENNKNILVMELLGKNLECILEKFQKFSIKTTCILGYQMLQLLKYIHDRHIIHRDIKPENFALGRKKYNASLYLIDFGLSKKYRSSKTLRQHPLVKKKGLTGTARFASINALQGYEQSRRDDLESLGYVLFYFLKGSLPWQNIKVKNKDDRYAGILKKKMELSGKDLSAGLPSEFGEILDYFKKLDYTEEPNYEKCCKKLLTILEKNNLVFDYVYDWTTDNNLKEREYLKKHSQKVIKHLDFFSPIYSRSPSKKNVPSSPRKQRDKAKTKKRRNSHFIKFEKLDNNDEQEIKIIENDYNDDEDDKKNKKKKTNMSNMAEKNESDNSKLEPQTEFKCCDIF